MTHQQSSSRDQRQDQKYLLSRLFLVTFIFGVINLPITIKLYAQPASSPTEIMEVKLPQPMSDKGILSDLDSKVKISTPLWLPKDQLQVYRWSIANHHKVLGLFYRHHLLNVFPFKHNTLRPAIRDALIGLSPTLKVNHPPPLPTDSVLSQDRDHDGIFDSLDIYIGALKTALNGAEYQEGYQRLKYPLGDVPREIGVCTDVIVRAFRNAGWDLQTLLYKDMLSHPKAYGLRGKRPNRNIDHRRVRRLIVYFKRHYTSLPISFDSKQTEDEAWLPGDILFMDTLDKGRPTHVGIVSSHLGESGTPQLINNWTYGYQTSEMNLAEIATYMYRFRITLPKQ